MTPASRKSRVNVGAVLEDLSLAVGGGLVAFGVWQIYHPAGLIVAGALLVVGVMLNARGVV